MCFLVPFTVFIRLKEGWCLQEFSRLALNLSQVFAAGACRVFETIAYQRFFSVQNR